MATDDRGPAASVVGRRLQLRGLNDQRAVDKSEPIASGDAACGRILAVGGEVQHREMRHIQIAARRLGVEDAATDRDGEDGAVAGVGRGHVTARLVAVIEIGGGQRSGFGRRLEAVALSWGFFSPWVVC